MSEFELPFSIPTNLDELHTLFLETRAMLAETWAGLPAEAMTCRPGPKPDWSVKDTIAHLCFWESFSLSRITILAAGEKLHLISDYDTLNQQVFDLYKDMPLDTVLGIWAANQPQIEGMIGMLTFAEWEDETRPNFKDQSLMRMLGGNTFGHYYEHLDDLKSYKEKF